MMEINDERVYGKKEIFTTTDFAQNSEPESCEAIADNIEDVVITEQLVVGNGVVARPNNVKMKHNDLSDLSKQVVKIEVSPAVQMKACQQQEIEDSNTSEYSSKPTEATGSVIYKYDSNENYSVQKYPYSFREEACKQDVDDFNVFGNGVKQGFIYDLSERDSDSIKNLPSCDLCSYATSSRVDLKTHIDSIHSNLKPQERDLRDNVTTRIIPRSSVHLKLKQHECDFCEFATNEKKHLKLHIESVHLHSKEHKCIFCDYSSNTKNDLVKHVNSVHPNSKQHKCSLCDFTPTWKGALKEHLKVSHSSQKQFKCPNCAFVANLKEVLKKHVDSVHSTLHMCHLCDYTTSHWSSLTRHIDNIHLRIGRK